VTQVKGGRLWKFDGTYFTVEDAKKMMYLLVHWQDVRLSRLDVSVPQNEAVRHA
jgi:hypothetical protein